MNLSRRNSLDRNSESSTIVIVNDPNNNVNNAPTSITVQPNNNNIAINSNQDDTHSQISFHAAPPPPCQYPHPTYYHQPPLNQYEYGYNPSPYMYPTKPDLVVPVPNHQLCLPHHHIIRERTTNITTKPMVPFDKCPIIFSLLSLCLCPITCCCSLPAFVFAMCSYVDHRVRDVERFRINSDHSKRLIIVACVLGLLLIIIWAIFIFFYKDSFVNTISGHAKLFLRQMRSGDNGKY